MMGECEVEVRLPRFKLEQTYDLKDVLTTMGMVDAFDVAQSDFSGEIQTNYTSNNKKIFCLFKPSCLLPGMSSAVDLVLSKVVHKAFVEVNEEGTEAAASTAAIVSERSLMVTPSFIADHPFLFFIRHNPSRSVLFAGRYCSPE